MIYFLKKFNFNKLKAKSYKLNAGMTYVELIVVLSIFSVLSSVAIFNYGDFQAKVDIKNMSSDIALKIVEAQKSSLTGLLPASGAPTTTWKPSYGIYFNSSTGLDSDGISFNKKFIYFVDLDNDNNYAGLPSCTVECLSKIIITKNNYISRIDKCMDDACTSPITINSFSVVFKRPDSRANFSTNSGLSISGSEYIKITIKSPKEGVSLIKIYPSGRIEVK